MMRTTSRERSEKSIACSGALVSWACSNSSFRRTSRYLSGSLERSGGLKRLRYSAPYLRNQSRFLKTIVSLLRNNNVVDDAEAENMGGLHELAVYAKVGVAGAKITARVIVGENNRGRAVGNHVGEHLARVNLAAVKQTDCNDSLLDYLVCAVERDADKMLLRSADNVLKQGENVLRNPWPCLAVACY